MFQSGLMFLNKLLKNQSNRTRKKNSENSLVTNNMSGKIKSKVLQFKKRRFNIVLYVRKGFIAGRKR